MRVPAYEPQPVAPAAATTARFRAADNGGGLGGAIGAGLAQLGGDVARQAQAEEMIALHEDDLDQRERGLAAQQSLRTITATFSQKQGRLAIDGRDGALKEVEDVFSQALGAAKTPRSRSMLEEALQPYLSTARADIAQHSSAESFQRDVELAEMDRDGADEEAAGAADDAAMLRSMERVTAANQRLGALMGWDGAQVSHQIALSLSRVHARRIEALVVRNDADKALAAFDAHKGLLIGDDLRSVERMLHEPRATRQGRRDTRRILSGTKPQRRTTPTPDRPSVPTSRVTPTSPAQPARTIGPLW